MNNLLEHYGIGFTLGPDNPVQLAGGLIQMKGNPIETIIMGLKGLGVENSFYKK